MPEITIFVFCMLILFILCSACIAVGDDEVNVSEFGRAWLVSEDEKLTYAPQIADCNEETIAEVKKGQALQVEWLLPRSVHTIAVKGPELPDPGDIEVQYWNHIWPNNGTGGWQRVDDPFNGNWITGRFSISSNDKAIYYKFEPLSVEENPRTEHSGFTYRRTYKLRLVFKKDAKVSEIEAYTGAKWKTANIRMEWAQGNEKPVKVDATNARIVSIEGSDNGPISVKLQYSDSEHRLSPDRGYVTFRSEGWNSFSVFVDDVIREGVLRVRDIEAYVSDASRNLSAKDWKKPADAWDATIMEKVAKMPEQTLEQVSKHIPDKHLKEAFLGVPNMRQEFEIFTSGNIGCRIKSLRGPGLDTDRRVWDVYFLQYAVSTLEKPIFDEFGGRQVTRYLEDGWMPIIHSEWKTGDIGYHKSAYATMLMEPIGKNEDARKGHEPILLLEKTEIKNNSDNKQTAYFWIELSLKRPMKIADDGLLLLDAPSDGKARPGLTPQRGRIDINGKGRLELVPDCVPAAPGSPDRTIGNKDTRPREAIKYTVELAPGETHTIYTYITYIELLDDNELAALRSANYESRYGEVVDYWKKRTASGMQYECPEPVLNDFYKANLWHILITTDKDPETGLHQHGAATVEYHNYLNETGMVAQSLEMRGEFKEAYRLLEPFIKSQGAKPLPGNFKSQDGLFYAAYPYPDRDCYTAQGYNMHHGWGLWKIAEHYFYTRDKEYLQGVADKLVAGCDWVTRERQATKFMNPDGTKPVEWGLAPAGDLEDVEEYLYWYATNAYYYVGMRTVANALAEIGHPEASRIAKDAEDYRQDILESIKETIATSPVVKLKDGSYIPYVAPRAYVVNDRKEGWIREGLYPSLHLIEGEVVEPQSQIMTWMLQELEDNIFLSKESGYGVENQLENFFHFGGFNLQPNLCPNATAHLRRDEIPNFIRVFWNTFRVSFWPDIVCFAEWVSYYGKGDGPVYKTPDECKFIQFMRNMIIFEEGNELRLGMGVPRAWMENGKKIKN